MIPFFVAFGKRAEIDEQAVRIRASEIYTVGCNSPASIWTGRECRAQRWFWFSFIWILSSDWLASCGSYTVGCNSCLHLFGSVGNVRFAQGVMQVMSLYWVSVSQCVCILKVRTLINLSLVSGFFAACKWFNHWLGGSVGMQIRLQSYDWVKYWLGAIPARSHPADQKAAGNNISRNVRVVWVNIWWIWCKVRIYTQLIIIRR